MKRVGVSLLFVLSLTANPHDPSVIHGDVKFDGLGTSHITIEASDRSIIHWDGFSIGSEEITHFLQEHSDASVLNRVMGSEISRIDGSLLSSGRVFLVNGNGIIIGKDAIIDVGSLIASSFDISNLAFIDQEDLLFDGKSIESIENYGDIKAKGYVLLFSHRIENSGSIRADSVFLGAGHRILVGVKGREFLYVDPELPGDGIENSGEIQALQTILEANTAPFSLGIQNKGSIDAFILKEEKGEIYLSCQGSSITNTGEMNANGNISILLEETSFENYQKISGEKIFIHADGASSKLSDQKPVSNYGKISGKTIGIFSSKFENDGSLFGKDEISIFAPGAYLETQNGFLTTDGGMIRILAGNYFTSGTLFSKGGMIEVEAERFLAVASRFDASSSSLGGQIKLASNSFVSPIYLNDYVRIDASGFQRGGSIEIHSPLPISTDAEIACDGKEQGELIISSGFIHKKTQNNILDPNPNEEPIFWSAFSQNKEPMYAASLWQTWDYRLKWLDHDISLHLAACPPTRIELEDPNASGTSSGFGDVIQTLSSGNVVVTKPTDDFAAMNAGAVYLYNATTGALISTLRGSSANDSVGNGGITTLTNSNYIISSSSWNNGANSNAGAVTFGNGSTGVSGTVSIANSLVGTTASSFVGSSATALTNGNYVVRSPDWNDGVLMSLGAVTFGNGTTGTTGAVSSANSLVGTQNSDQVGVGSVTALTNGNYVVRSSLWNNGGVASVGAVTFGNGTTGITGAVSASNSLVGTQTNDLVGGDGLVVLTNGNYVVRSSSWDNGGIAGVGAVTFGSGTTGITGIVSSSNSLIGTQLNDAVGSGGVIALTNGNYVVESPSWDNGGISTAGAVTFGNGTTGIAGVVSATNSLVGTQADDAIGFGDVTVLTNGNYVVKSPGWDNGAVSNAGAVTFGNGTTGITGAVSASNSLVGTQANDLVGNSGVTSLTNGNYVVKSPNWDNGGVADVGAATFGNGTTGITGAVSTSNSLVGTQANDSVGNIVTALTNGNYVVNSISWSNGPISSAGAVTFGNGTTGITGVVSPTNSLVGGTAFDFVGSSASVALTNGNYVAISPVAQINGISGAGAVTFGNGTTGVTGVVSSANSLVGTTINDNVGTNGMLVLTNGNYVVITNTWNNAGAANAGAVTFGNGTTGIAGAVSTANSIVGSTANDSVGNGDFLELSSGEFVFLSPSWDNGANSNAGAVTIVNSNTGAFCDGNFGAVSAANSVIGENASTGLSSISTGNILPNNNIVLIRFNNFNGETRVFSIAGAISSTSTSLLPIEARGIHDYAVSMQEPFDAWQSLSLKGFLEALSIFGGWGTNTQLHLKLPNLEAEKENEFYDYQL